MLKIKNILAENELVFEQIKVSGITKKQKLYYHLVATVLAIIIVIAPIIILITLFLYHELVNLLGLLIVILLMLMFYLESFFYLKMIKNDFPNLANLSIKPVLLLNMFLYLSVGVIVYIIYFMIVRLIL